MTDRDCVTVTVQRTRPGGVTALTVEVHWREEALDWLVAGAMDEDGNDVQLTKTENLLARCLAKGGVDETGR